MQGAIFEGLESSMRLVHRCAIYEGLYLNSTNANTGRATVDNLEKELVNLYTNILTYLSKSRRYHSRNKASEFQIGPPECPR